jgi:hypothetical protein
MDDWKSWDIQTNQKTFSAFHLDKDKIQLFKEIFKKNEKNKVKL